MPKITWLDRALVVSAHCITLCSTQERFDAVLKSLEINDKIPFVNEGSNGTTHYIEIPDSDFAPVAVVGIKPSKDANGVQIAAMIVHEAVHIWQKTREYIGEKEPSSEFEAYAIQTISQRLMEEYQRQMEEAK